VPRRTRANHGLLAAKRQEIARLILGQQQFRRAQALELGLDRARLVRLQHRETARGQLEPRQAEAIAFGQQRRQQRFAPLVEQRIIGEGAGRDHSHHAPFHRPAGLAWIADLLADRHRLAAPHQAVEVGVDALHRHAGHGYRGAR
jgi:hypothetical protein